MDQPTDLLHVHVDTVCFKLCTTSAVRIVTSVYAIKVVLCSHSCKRKHGQYPLQYAVPEFAASQPQCARNIFATCPRRHQMIPKQLHYIEYAFYPCHTFDSIPSSGRYCSLEGSGHLSSCIPTLHNHRTVNHHSRILLTSRRLFHQPWFARTRTMGTRNTTTSWGFGVDSSCPVWSM